MHLLRCLFFVRARFQFEAWAVHTPGVDNGIADAISRNNLYRFYSQVPAARVRRVPIPPPLMALLVGQQPDWLGRGCSGAVFRRPSAIHMAELQIRDKTLSRVLPYPAGGCPFPYSGTCAIPFCGLAPHPESLVQHH